MEITVRVPGSCGELIQGCLHKKPFLVTCPIDRFSTAVVRDDGKQTLPAGEKSRQALLNTLAYLGKNAFPYSLTLKSEIPAGKGMASSSADVAATIIAVSAAFGKKLHEQEIAFLAASVEPTDGVFCRGIVAINYMTGEILHSYGVFPPLVIAVFDSGGMIDTVAFHQTYDQQILCDCSPSASALRWLYPPYSAAAIGAAATYSAKMHQHILYKPILEALCNEGMKSGAVGVAIAHSGTVCGLLFPPEYDNSAINCLALSLSRKLSIAYAGTSRLISGGWAIEER